MSSDVNPMKRWVSVICTCYNHGDYVEQALKSVIDQTHPFIELIVIDNGSTDESPARIAAFASQHPSIRFIFNSINVGLNRAFNQGLALARGHYVIDLSADDVLLPDRIARQVHRFEQLPDTYAVVFSNAAYIDRAGKQTGVHYSIDSRGHARSPIPSGDVFQAVLESYFICTPTMMMRREMLDALGGYDETLAYEDFDLWIRSARQYRYAYVDEVLTLKRQLPNSLSTQVTQRNNRLLPSTLIVCRKAFDRCITPAEFKALANRLRTFIRKAFYAEQFDLTIQFGELLRQIEPPDLLSHSILLLSRLQLPVNALYRIYLHFFPKQVN
jgi:glycosyltransferase involved in cell wall biosynthesis